MSDDKNDPHTDPDKNGLNEMFNHQANYIKMSRHYDSLTSDYVDLKATVEGCVFKDIHGVWKLKPEIAQYLLTLDDDRVAQLTKENSDLKKMVAKFKPNNNLDKQKSQLDNTDNKDNDN